MTCPSNGACDWEPGSSPAPAAQPAAPEGNGHAGGIRFVSRTQADARASVRLSSRDAVTCGPGRFLVIAGPCAVEDEEQTMTTARAVKRAGASALRGGAFKPRTSPYAFRGLGLRGLELLAQARAETGLPIVTEVLSVRDIDVVARHSDVLQVGARSMHNYSLLEEVGRTGKTVLLKRGLAATVEEWLLAAEYVAAQGNDQIILCERGIRTFETCTRNTLDLSAVLAAQAASRLPVIVDPSHAAGHCWMVGALSLAGLAVGADGVMVEVHPRPESARCDGDQALRPQAFEQMMSDLRRLAPSVGRRLTAREVRT